MKNVAAEDRFVPHHEFIGGYLQGYFTASYDDLVVAFGPPATYDRGKVSTEWCIRDTATGAVFTLYDYKETDAYDPDFTTRLDDFRSRSSYRWHVGGIREHTCDQHSLARFVEAKAGR